MTLHRITISCLTLGLLVTACDLGEKSIGNDTGADQGDVGDGDGDSGDGDGDSGDGDGDGDGDPGGCGAQTVSIIDDPNEELPGFAELVVDYLAVAEGTYLGEFVWSPNDGPRTVEHAGTMSPLTLSVTYEGGEIRLTEVAHVGELPGGDPGGFACSNTLEIDVRLDFVTDDGLFAESFEIPLLVYSHGGPSVPTLYFSLDMDALQGQLSLDDFSFEDGEITDLILTAEFSGDAVNGGLGMEVAWMDWVGFGGIANFDAAREP
jgi:hypothetical protein